MSTLGKVLATLDDTDAKHRAVRVYIRGAHDELGTWTSLSAERVGETVFIAIEFTSPRRVGPGRRFGVMTFELSAPSVQWQPWNMTRAQAIKLLKARVNGEPIGDGETVCKINLTQ